MLQQRVLRGLRQFVESATAGDIELVLHLVDGAAYSGPENAGPVTVTPRPLRRRA